MVKNTGLQFAKMYTNPYFLVTKTSQRDLLDAISEETVSSLKLLKKESLNDSFQIKNFNDTKTFDNNTEFTMHMSNL